MAGADGSFRLWTLSDLRVTSATAPVERSDEELSEILSLLRGRSCLTRRDMAAALAAAVTLGGTEEGAHPGGLPCCERGHGAPSSFSVLAMVACPWPPA